MREEHVGRRFAHYVSLSVLSMTSLALYYLTDTFFIANRCGTLGMASLNFSIPIYALLVGVGLLLGVGGATCFTIHKSRGETEEGNIVFTNMVILGAVLSFLCMLVGWFLPGPLASLMGARDTVHEMTKLYLGVLLTFTPCFVYSYIFVAFMRNDNAPRFSTICMVMGALMNILLDYIFMYPMEMGIFGAALATGISPLVGMVTALVLYILPGKATFHLRRCRPDLRLMLWCCSLGTSSFIGQLSVTVVVTVTNLVMFSLAKDVGVAAYGVISNLTSVIVAVFNGIIQGGQPLISDYYARGMVHEERRTLHLCIITSVALGLFCWVSALLFAPQIAAAFNGDHDPAFAVIAEPGLRIYFTGFLLVGVNMTFAQMFAAVERPKESMAVSISRGLVVIVTMVLVLSRIWGITGVWMSLPTTEVITALLALTLYLRFRKHENKKLLEL